MRSFFASLVLLLVSELAMADTTPLSLAVMLLKPEVAASPDPVVCVGLDGKDAPADLLDALRNVGKEIVTTSACVGDIAGSY